MRVQPPPYHSHCRAILRAVVAMGKGGADGDVNEIVQQFVVYFYRHIRERNGAGEPTPCSGAGKRVAPRACSLAPREAHARGGSTATSGDGWMGWG